MAQSWPSVKPTVPRTGRVICNASSGRPPTLGDRVSRREPEKHPAEARQQGRGCVPLETVSLGRSRSAIRIISRTLLVTSTCTIRPDSQNILGKFKDDNPVDIVGTVTHPRRALQPHPESIAMTLTAEER